LSTKHKPKILIFTSKTGGGHISLAEALRDRLANDYVIEMLDPQPGIIHLHYRLVSRHALWVWAREYTLSDGPRRSRMVHLTYTVLMQRYVAHALRRSQPDLVISTYPFLTCEVTHAIKRMHRKIPFVMLFADPNGVHQSWLTERRASAVFAPTRETFAQALQAKFVPERLFLSGWPVRGQFYRNSDARREEMLTKLGLNPRAFTVFLQGGGEGAAKFMRTVENVLALPGLQIILAAGTNQALYERFHDVPNVHALPFTKEIAPIMGAADVIMGKAGPNMLFESVTLGKPFIATAYIPGQEQANLEFIQRHRLGWVALDGASQQALLRSLAGQQAVLAEMRAGVDAYRQWNTNANQTIPVVVKNLVAEAHRSRHNA
jgi:UDP-N-acetylglucosamine:LPS N-acetylglucosamine transferase